MATLRSQQSETSTDDVLQLAADRARRYAAGIHDRRVSPGSRELSALSAFHEPFPSGPTDPLAVVALLDDVGSPATNAATGGRYFGFVTGAALPASLGSRWLADAWNQNVALRVMSPVGAELEDIALDWVRDILGLPTDCEGGLVTCATVANFTALVAARQSLAAKAGWNIAEDGMFGAPPIDVVVGAEVHASIQKALSLAGLGRNRVTIVEADAQGRMRADKLPKLSDRTILCLQAGNVNSGSFDPAAEICPRAREQGAWIHVDGAFGLWANASPKYRHLVAGFELADSWGTDAHKWPNVGYDCGVLFVRDAFALCSAMTMSAAYLQPGQRRERMYHTPDSSRRPRGIELWAALKSLGRSGLCDLVERTCGFASQFADGFRRAGFEVLNEVVINQVLVSFGAAEVTNVVIQRVQEDGACWCGGTVWHGKAAMRISVSSWATTAEDVERSLASILRIARELP